MDNTCLPATHTRTIPAFTPQPQRHRPLAAWYSLRLLTKDGQAKLTWVAGYIPRSMSRTAPFSADLMYNIMPKNYFANDNVIM